MLFNPIIYTTMAQALRSNKQEDVGTNLSLNKNLQLKEEILWQKAFSYGFSEFRSD
jgi:hypothetical protein